MTFPILLAAFIFVPIIEIGLFVKVGSLIGTGATILVVIFTAVLGAYLVRQQGFATLQSVQLQMNQGRMPAMQLAEGVLLLFAGAVLLTPGFATDALGFILLVPGFRRKIIQSFIKKGVFQAHAAQQTYTNADPYNIDRNGTKKPNNSTIEGEYTERD